MRTVRVRATNAQLEELIELCEVMEQETRREREKHEQATAKRAKPNFVKELHSTIGYLATWAMPESHEHGDTTGYRRVLITTNVRNGTPEVMARYYNNDTPQKDERESASIFAIWHGDHWGFHQ